MASQSNSNKAFPIKFKVVQHIRGQQQSETIIYAQPKINNSYFMHAKTHKNESTAVINEENEPYDEVEAKVRHISKHPQWGDDLEKDEDKPIINCIGRVYFRVNENDTFLRSGTGTVIKKLENDFIAILTCAHIVVGDDGNYHDTIWFSPNPEDINEYDTPKYGLRCFAYYPKERYNQGYNPQEKHSENDMAILICKDREKYYQNISVNNVMRLIDSNQK
eukprot:102719_1